MLSRAKRRTVSWNIRSSSLRTVKGGGGRLDVSAKFGISHLSNLQSTRRAAIPQLSRSTLLKCLGWVYNPTTGGAYEKVVDCPVADLVSIAGGGAGWGASGIPRIAEMHGGGSGYRQDRGHRQCDLRERYKSHRR